MCDVSFLFLCCALGCLIACTISNVNNVVCTAGYTSGSDLQGKATIDSHENSRDSRGAATPADNGKKSVTARCSEGRL